MDLDEYIAIKQKRRSQLTPEDYAFLAAWRERRELQQAKNALVELFANSIQFVFLVTAAFFIWQLLTWIWQ